MAALSGPSLRIAVVGAGPAGFYAAGRLLSAPQARIEVDMLDRLPTPWGLVRGGVAPDHPKIKSVSRVFEKIAADPAFRFYGNVDVGRHVSDADLATWYHAVIYAVGTAGDRRSGIPGEDLHGSWSATEFVGWYNGHPDYQHLHFDLSAERAIVVGNGNVALDLARMLTLTREELAVTDIADHALEALAASQIREVVVLGRRGPYQAAFTNPELRELGELADADVVVPESDLALGQADAAGAVAPATERNLELLRAYARRKPSGTRKRIVLRFLLSPVELLGGPRVEAVRVVRNTMVPDEHGVMRSRPTDVHHVLDAGIVFRAIGYVGIPLAGVPFDERSGRIPNAGGRVLDGDFPVPGKYVAGWMKRGPSGVIGTNKKCAHGTVAAVLEDIGAGLIGLRDVPTAEATGAELGRRSPDLVTYAAWQAIDRAELAAGRAAGRPRVKFVRMEDLLDSAGRRPALVASGGGE